LCHRVKEASGGSENLWAGGSATEGLLTNWSLMMLSRACRDIVASARREKAGKIRTDDTMTGRVVECQSVLIKNALMPPCLAGKKGGGKQKIQHTAGYMGDLVPLLTDSLTGDALTAIFVCVSQAPANVMQSKIALDFGETFSKLTMGRSRQKPQVSGIIPLHQFTLLRPAQRLF
jgi:hypothetical protein